MLIVSLCSNGAYILECEKEHKPRVLKKAFESYEKASLTSQIKDVWIITEYLVEKNDLNKTKQME